MVAQLAIRMQEVTLGWLALELTGSPFYVGLVGFARGLPLCLSFLTGPLVDTKDRRQLLTICQAIGTVILALLATLASVGWVGTWQLPFVALLLGTVTAVYFATSMALIPNLINSGDLANAVTLDFAGGNAMLVLGPVLAGLTISTVGVSGCLYLQAFACLSTLAFFLRISARPVKSIGTRIAVWQSLREEWQYIRKSDTLSTVFGLAAVIIPLGMPYRELMPVFARDVLDVGPSGLGLLTAAPGLGAMAMALIIAAVGDMRRKGVVLLGGATLLGIMLILFSFSGWFHISLLLLIGVGGVGAAYLTTTNTLLQVSTHDRLRGRITSAYLLTWGLMPFGSLLAGTIASFVGAPVGIALGGALCILFSLRVGLANPRVRDVDWGSARQCGTNP